MTKFDFVILASHGTGLTSVLRMLKYNLNLQILDFESGNILRNLEAFLRNNYDFNGIAIDDAFSTKNKKHIYKILEYIKDNIPLVILTRDPLEQIFSVVNTHIRYWTGACTGSNTYKLTDLLLFKKSSIENLILNILNQPNMWTTVLWLPLLIKRCKEILFLGMNDISPENSLTSLKIINKFLTNTEYKKINYLPNSPMFSQANRFVNHIPPFIFYIENIKISLSPCPISFCHFYGYDKNLSIIFNPKLIDFKLGEFEGDIGFFLDKENELLLKFNQNDLLNEIKNILEKNNFFLIKQYCKLLSDRYTFSLNIFEHLKLDFNKFIQLSKDNKKIKLASKKYILEHISTLQEYHFDKVTSWETSFKYLDFFRTPPHNTQI